jgi:DNA-directed RNA polymerase specialized sigma24 family protein
VDEVPDAAIESDPDRYALADALRSLPRPLREAFSMLTLKGHFSVSAAAARASVTPGALKVRAHRAYKALKLLLGDSWGG